MKNYRAISLLIDFSKVFEKVMDSRLSQHLHTNNIQVTEQYRVRKGISTENAAFRITDCVLKSINQYTQVAGVFCGLAKAFDCINHEILITKLHFYGI
jgi:hypothetical protein